MPLPSVPGQFVRVDAPLEIVTELALCCKARASLQRRAVAFLGRAHTKGGAHANQMRKITAMGSCGLHLEFPLFDRPESCKNSTDDENQSLLMGDDFQLLSAIVRIDGIGFSTSRMATRSKS